MSRLNRIADGEPSLGPQESRPGRTLTARSNEELRQLPLHDQYFDVAGVEYSDGRVVLTCFIDDGLPHVVRTRRSDGRPRRFDVPLRAATLTVTAAKAPRVTDDQRIGVYTFNEVSFDGEVVRIEANEALVIEIPAQVCDVVLVISDAVGAHVTRTQRWLSNSEHGFKLLLPAAQQPE